MADHTNTKSGTQAKVGTQLATGTPLERHVGVRFGVEFVNWFESEDSLRSRLGQALGVFKTKKSLSFGSDDSDPLAPHHNVITFHIVALLVQEYDLLEKGKVDYTGLQDWAKACKESIELRAASEPGKLETATFKLSRYWLLPAYIFGFEDKFAEVCGSVVKATTANGNDVDSEWEKHPEKRRKAGGKVRLCYFSSLDPKEKPVLLKPRNLELPQSLIRELRKICMEVLDRAADTDELLAKLTIQQVRKESVGVNKGIQSGDDEDQ
ncbi:hypothetical protein BJ508DRAFT_380145 [Ascobolus immersus RN42]|uniref:Uncharacterized protein n=1 Tax=Ascobolus immersus RN42 TaxID=1160509 RepID=A0A3N4HU03_ASCIM|nr:hypothetical protein BJ508DRAFT_380145 [Ascobolus immersus RN42]